jgi:hypothetical protein
MRHRANPGRQDNGTTSGEAHVPDTMILIVSGGGLEMYLAGLICETGSYISYRVAQSQGKGLSL